MKSIDSRRRRRTWGFGVLRWLAILSMTGLFSLLLAPVNLAGAVDPIALSSSASSSLPVGRSVTLTATLSSGQSDVTITFTITGANDQTLHADTNAQGKASITYIGTDHGTDSITATDGTNTSDPVTVFWSELVLSPATQTLPVGDEASIAVHLYNDAPAGVDGIKIFYTISGKNDEAKTFVTTNADGEATIHHTGALSGTDVIDAWADLGADTDQGPNEPTAEASMTFASYTVSLSPSNLSRNIGTDAELTATVRDQDNDLVEGIEVHFIVSGDHSLTDSDTTDDDGQATLTYSEVTDGVDQVRAFIDLDGDEEYDTGEPTSTSTVEWFNISLDIAPSIQDRAVGDEAEFTATVTGTAGDLDDLWIRYSVSGDNSASGRVTTAANGRATFDYQGTDPGTDTVTAWVDLDRDGRRDNGEPVDTAQVDWIAAEFALVPSSQTAVLGTHVSITATLSNDFTGESDVVIRYSVDGANDTSGTVTTNSSGNATISYLGSETGNDEITAFADFDNDGVQDAGEPSDTATVVWTGTASIVLSPAIQDATINASASVTATVTSGNTSIDGVTVRYVVSGANSRSGSVTTNGSGIANITYTGTNTGTDYVWAFVDLNNDGSLGTGEPATTVTINWVSGETTPPVTPPGNAPDAANPAPPKAGCTYFPETHHNMCGDFASYWNAFGGLAIYGFPITETFQEGGFTVQYFERARFEEHPGTDDAKFNVLLGLVGNEVTAGRSGEAPFQPTTDKNSADCTYYAATGHNLCAGFQAYWEKYGGLAVYGYPISEEFQEVNPDTGLTYTVQYFERARYEWHPGEWPERFDVELGRLGSQVFSMKYGTEYH